jgi:protein phosphatase PTC7
VVYRNSHGVLGCPGVADGVGGWAEMGIDPGEYARKLMSSAKESAGKTPISREAPLRILTDAYYATHVQARPLPSRC